MEEEGGKRRGCGRVVDGMEEWRERRRWRRKAEKYEAVEEWEMRLQSRGRERCGRERRKNPRTWKSERQDGGVERK